MRVLIIAASTVLASSACAQVPDAAPVVAAERAFSADFPALGLAGSFQKWSRPDAIIIDEGQARAVADVFSGAPLTRPEGQPILKWWPTFAGIAMSGDLGFTTGPAAQDDVPYGHYFTIWQRQADGRWLWVYDGGSGASPTGQPGPGTSPRLMPVATVGSTSPEAAMAEVKAAEAVLAAAARDDQKAAYLAAMANDGRLYVAPHAPAETPEAFAEALTGWPARFEFGPTAGGGSSAAGDLVWTYGPAAWARDGAPRQGHYMRLWQKRAEGWRLVMAQLIPTPIAAPPPAGG